MNREQETAMYDQPDDVEHIDVSEDDLHAEVDSWLENVPADRCTGAYLAERFAQWQASRKVEVTTDEREALIGIMREARNPDGHAVLRYEDAADAILSAGFRRGSHEAHR